jgi:hypothetical protein
MRCAMDETYLSKVLGSLEWRECSCVFRDEVVRLGICKSIWEFPGFRFTSSGLRLVFGLRNDN